jgi:hypothetical protein
MRARGLPTVLLVAVGLVTGLGATPAAAEECTLTPRAACFGVESVSASLASTQEGVPAAQAGAHPDLNFDVTIRRDPLSAPNVFELQDSFAATRDIRIETPPGLIGDPNVLGTPQQCTPPELFSWNEPGGGCPNGSQVGITTVTAYNLNQKLTEPIYMMTPPGGDVIARLGLIAGAYPTLINLRVRSEHQDDFGLTAEVTEASAIARLIELESTLWGIPASPAHDNERCTAGEVFTELCVTSPSRPPGSRELPFLTNPTRCGVPLTLTVNATSWFEPDFDTSRQASASFPEEISGCSSLSYGPSLTVKPTNRRPSSPTGLEMTIRQPAAEGVAVLEPSQTRDIHIDLPQGVRINPGSAHGLDVCSVAQVRLEENVRAECPDAAKLASVEIEVTGLPRRLKGAIYLREPEPENLFRIWVVADDLGAHVKLPGQLELDKNMGQIKSVVVENPQVPLREAKLSFKSGFRAPLMTPSVCGQYFTHYDFTPWSGGPDAVGDVPMSFDEGCEEGGFAPELSAGSTDATGGIHSPFVFTIRREDEEQNLSGLSLALPRGIAATFAGIDRCEGVAAETGQCPANSLIGNTTVADGVGPNPLWVPQPGKDPTAIYLGGPYRGAPLSIVAVVPAQAGPFDLGDEVVRSAIYIDPETAQATATTDPLPQFIEGIPIVYKTIGVNLNRPGFSLNPTSCAKKQTVATLVSTGGRTATATSTYQATNCARLSFKPKLSLRLMGGTHRGGHPALRATLTMPKNSANVAGASVALPRSEFVDNAHFNNVCTRVQFAAHECPAGSVYGFAIAKTPLFDFPLEGPVYLRSAPSRVLPDVVAALRGPPSMPIEVDLDGHVDSVHGGLRTTFTSAPDAPVTKFILQMQGGKKSLLENSTNLCAHPHYATAKFEGQNGRNSNFHPLVQAVACRSGRKIHR